MGIYSHETTERLRELRSQFSAALTERLTGPSRVDVSGQSVSFNNRALEYQRAIDDLKKAIEQVNTELRARGIDDSLSNAPLRRPIYLVGR
jgi:uncharacterized protein YukE